MDSPHDEIQRDLGELATLGAEMERILESEAFKTGLTIVRGRIFENFTRSTSSRERDELHAEVRALDRLMGAFRTLDEEGLIARRRLEQMNAEL